MISPSEFLLVGTESIQGFGQTAVMAIVESETAQIKHFEINATGCFFTDSDPNFCPNSAVMALFPRTLDLDRKPVGLTGRDEFEYAGHSGRFR
jgi:hypothetical protein